MSTEEVSQIMAEVEGDTSERAEANVSLAVQEVTKILSVTNDSLAAICLAVEEAGTKADLKAAFRRLNAITQIFLQALPAPEHADILRDAFSRFQSSDRLLAFLNSSSSLRDAITLYKTTILQELAISLRRREELTALVDAEDDDLFAQFLPATVAPVPSVDSGCPTEGVSQVDGPSRKRHSSVLAEQAVTPVKKSKLPSLVAPIPKKSRVPALASIDRVTQSHPEGLLTKKKLLLTREKLRAGFHNPKGLLNLVDSSTNALEHTNNVELLNAAGYQFNSQNKSTFSDKLNSAILRLDLGLGAHSLSDTYLFGAKVLSSPGFLSKKNITEIENNVVDGKAS